MYKDKWRRPFYSWVLLRPRLLPPVALGNSCLASCCLSNADKVSVPLLSVVRFNTCKGPEKQTKCNKNRMEMQRMSQEFQKREPKIRQFPERLSYLEAQLL